jgi:Ca2+-binding EF-hand superfamily protein
VFKQIDQDRSGKIDDGELFKVTAYNMQHAQGRLWQHR